MARMLDKTNYYQTLLYLHSGQTGMSPPRSFSKRTGYFPPFVMQVGREIYH